MERNNPPTKTVGPAGLLVGHRQQRDMLRRLAKTNRLPSAMLFAGPQGVGKTLVAQELARSIFCSDTHASYGGCGRCAGCRHVTSGNCPDLLTADCMNRDEFDLDRLRELLHTLSMRPFLGGARIVLLTNAEHLSIQAANLLLKSLEEPRPGNHFILVCSNPGMLPPTLLSRCQIWFFDRLQATEIRQVLASQGYNSQELDDVIALADGSLATVTSLREQRETWQTLRSDLRAIADGNFVRASQLATEIAKQKEKLRDSLQLLRIAARQELFGADIAADSFRWSTCVLDLLAAERLIFERNLGAQYVLNLILSRLSNQRAFTRALGGATLLDHITI